MDWQSEKSKKAGNPPPTTQLLEFLKNSYSVCSDILLLEEDMNFNSRAASLLVIYLIMQFVFVFLKNLKVMMDRSFEEC